MLDIHDQTWHPAARRSNQAAILTFNDADPVVEIIRARISATLDLPLPRFEASQVLHYLPGQEFKPHHDYFDPAADGFQQEIAERGQRVATFLIYLNDARLTGLLSDDLGRLDMEIGKLASCDSVREFPKSRGHLGGRVQAKIMHLDR